MINVSQHNKEISKFGKQVEMGNNLQISHHKLASKLRRIIENWIREETVQLITVCRYIYIRTQ